MMKIKLISLCLLSFGSIVKIINSWYVNFGHCLQISDLRLSPKGKNQERQTYFVGLVAYKYIIVNLVLIFTFLIGSVFLQTSIILGVNTAGKASGIFYATTKSGTVNQSTIICNNNTVALNLPTVSANAVFAIKEGYGSGSANSAYTIGANTKNGGYAGVCFATGSFATASTNTSYKPKVGYLQTI